MVVFFFVFRLGRRHQFKFSKNSSVSVSPIQLKTTHTPSYMLEGCFEPNKKSMIWINRKQKPENYFLWKCICSIYEWLVWWLDYHVWQDMGRSLVSKILHLLCVCDGNYTNVDQKKRWIGARELTDQQNHSKLLSSVAESNSEQYIYYFIYILCDSRYSNMRSTCMHVGRRWRLCCLCVRFLLTNFDWKNISWISSWAMKIFVHTKCRRLMLKPESCGSHSSSAAAYWALTIQFFHSFRSLLLPCAPVLSSHDGLAWALSSASFSPLYSPLPISIVTILFNCKQTAKNDKNTFGMDRVEKTEENTLHTRFFLPKIEIYTITEWMNAKKIADSSPPQPW